MFANQYSLSVGPFNTVRIREEADLLSGRQHVESLGDRLTHDVRKEVVPPVSSQTEIRQLSGQRAERLIGMTTGDKTLKLQLPVAPDDFAQL